LPLFLFEKGITPIPAPDRPIITVRTHILDRYIDYIHDNNLADVENSIREREYSDYMPIYLTAPVADYNPDAPGGIIVNYDHPDCPYHPTVLKKTES